MQFQKTQLRTAIRDILWGSGMVIAFLSLLVKLLAFSIIYMASQASNFTGPVEGHINRLKLLKRQAYGRAGLSHLQHRFLPAA